MSETSPSYCPEQSPIGYMPLPEVYGALDYVLAVARGEPGHGADFATPAAARAFLLTWLQSSALPSKEQLHATSADMAGQIDALVAAFGATLRSFVADLESHPSPLPGTAFGDYFPDLVSLSTGALANSPGAG